MDHVRKKLDVIVPYLVAGKRLPKQTPCRVHRGYAFVNDLLAVVIGLGVPPTFAAIAKAFVGESGETGADAAASNGGMGALWTALQDLPTWIATLTIAVLITWLMVKVYLKQANAAQKTALADNVEKQIAAHESMLDAILSKPEPIPELVVLQGKLLELRQTSITSDVWPWRPLPTDDAFKQECSNAVNEWCSRYAGNWTPPPGDTELRAA